SHQSPSPRSVQMATIAELLQRYECGPVRFSGDENASYERHLVFDHVVSPEYAHTRHKYEAVARAVRDLLAQRWLKTRTAHYDANPKRVYYLSMEFLIGRSLTNNIANLMVEPLIRDLVGQEGLKEDLARIFETEPAAGLGNGGLGRLAACFIDSLATLQVPAVGYGLRYEYGIFQQEIENGYQVERPDNWLRRADPWEVRRPEGTITLKLGSGIGLRSGQAHVTRANEPHPLRVPVDRPGAGSRA